MKFGDAAGAVLTVLTILAIMAGFARWVGKRLSTSREREIDDRLTAVLHRREQEQAGGTPIEKELRRQVDRLERELGESRDQHRKEIAELRVEHDREIADVRQQFMTEMSVLRAQLTEAYRIRGEHRETEN